MAPSRVRLETAAHHTWPNAELAALIARVEAEEADALALARKEGLVMGIEALCDALGIALDAERRAQMNALDTAGIDALLARLRRERAWPSTS